MADIRVPKTPKAAFNKNRPASDLLLRQVEHLEWAALPAAQRKPHLLRKHRKLTEGQTADLVAKLHKLVMEAKAKTPGPDDAKKLEPVQLPSVPKASGSKKPQSSKTKRRRNSAAKSRRRRRS